MRFFVKRSNVIALDETRVDFDKGLQSYAYSAQFDGLLEISILGELTPVFATTPYEMKETKWKLPSTPS